MPESLMAVVGLFRAVKDSFREHMPCEVEGHDTDPGHSGVGEWYVTHTCSNCKTSGVELSCAGFVGLMSNNLDMTVPCTRCEARSKLKDAITDLTQRQENIV